MTTELQGIDVSVYQGTIDWQAVHAHGVSFAGIKCTEGLGFVDPTFRENWAGAQLHNTQRIAYHFLRPELDGAQQASFLHAAVRARGRFSIGDGVMLDLEEMDGQTPARVIACAEAFVTQILHETRAGVFLYTGPYFWQGLLHNPRSAILAKCPLWLAEYGPDATRLDNWPSGLSIWQYSSTGRIPGIAGEVDMDRFYGSAQTLRTLCRRGGR